MGGAAPHAGSGRSWTCGSRRSGRAHRASVPAGVADLHVDHDGLEHAEFWAGYWDNGLVGTPLYYLPHLTRAARADVAVLSAIATAPEGALLFHCAGGRDRTGLIAAILLTLAGVEEDAIVADYLETITNAEALAVAQGRPSASRRSPRCSRRGARPRRRPSGRS